MLQVINNTSDPTCGYWIAYNGLLISGPYASSDQANRDMPRIQSVLDHYIELEVKGSTTIQLPANH